MSDRKETAASFGSNLGSDKSTSIPSSSGQSFDSGSFIAGKASSPLYPPLVTHTPKRLQILIPSM
ncbi:hypothetical protein [Parabacteroides goldsteinii]|uniref:hypothetical protein n=1 Tax=Parabacteroides goldsteinii TaxID=328812 RepID=UPI00256F342B|nr:hypothetical protein [Parabacteroides goldsteinii]